jgi:hypothetical protein
VLLYAYGLAFDGINMLLLGDLDDHNSCVVFLAASVFVFGFLLSL